MADISTTKMACRRESYKLHALRETVVYDIVPVTDGVVAHTTTHVLVPIPIGKMLVGGNVAFITSMGSTGAATFTFDCNSVALSGALSIAGTAAGKVHNFPINAATATAGAALYAATVALYVNMTVGVAAINAGRFLLTLDLIDVKALLNNG